MAEKKERGRSAEILSRHGELGSFVVRVQHRQNGTWQGRITWMEEGRTVNFRSVWEMVKLMENALDGVEPPAEDTTDWAL